MRFPQSLSIWENHSQGNVMVEILNRDFHCPYLLRVPGKTSHRNGGDIELQRFGGYRKCDHECSLSDYLVIDIFLYQASDTSPVTNIKAIRQLLK